jgi:hypothetical protein
MTTKRVRPISESIKRRGRNRNAHQIRMWTRAWNLFKGCTGALLIANKMGDEIIEKCFRYYRNKTVELFLMMDRPFYPMNNNLVFLSIC